MFHPWVKLVIIPFTCFLFNRLFSLKTISHVPKLPRLSNLKFNFKVDSFVFSLTLAIKLVLPRNNKRGKISLQSMMETILWRAGE